MFHCLGNWTRALTVKGACVHRGWTTHDDCSRGDGLHRIGACLPRESARMRAIRNFLAGQIPLFFFSSKMRHWERALHLQNGTIRWIQEWQYDLMDLPVLYGMISFDGKTDSAGDRRATICLYDEQAVHGRAYGETSETFCFWPHRGPRRRCRRPLAAACARVI